MNTNKIVNTIALTLTAISIVLTIGGAITILSNL